MNESQFVSKLINYWNKLPDSFFFKIHGGHYQSAGIPDIIGSYEGIFIGVECKVVTSPKRNTTGIPIQSKLVTKLQQHRLTQIADAGGTGLVAVLFEPQKQILWKHRIAIQDTSLKNTLDEINFRTCIGRENILIRDDISLPAPNLIKSLNFEKK